MWTTHGAPILALNPWWPMDCVRQEMKREGAGYPVSIQRALWQKNDCGRMTHSVDAFAVVASFCVAPNEKGWGSLSMALLKRSVILTSTARSLHIPTALAPGGSLCQSLSVVACHCVSLCAIAYHCMSLCVITCHCLSLHVIACHCALVSFHTIMRHCGLPLHLCVLPWVHLVCDGHMVPVSITSASCLAMACSAMWWQQHHLGAAVACPLQHPQAIQHTPNATTNAATPAMSCHVVSMWCHVMPTNREPGPHPAPPPTPAPPTCPLKCEAGGKTMKKYNVSI